MGTIQTEIKYDKSTKRRRVWRHIERVDAETGAVIRTDEEEDVYYGQKKFVQIETESAIKLFKLISGNARLVILVMAHKATRLENVVSATQAEIAEATGLSRKTVERCFVELQKVDACRKMALGRWMMNPLYTISCRRDRVPELRSKYESLPPYKGREKEESEETDDDS